MSHHDGTSRRDLAREANLVRSRLVRTVAELDRKRREAFDLRLQVGRHARELVVAGGVVLLLACGAIVVAARHASARDRGRWRARWRLLGHAWRHPERRLRAERAPLVADIARSAIVAIATAALALPVKRAIAHLAGPRAGDD